MFNLNLKIGICKDGYNPLITVKINDSVTYTLEKETTTLKLVNREYKLTFSCPNVDNSGKLENTIIINPTSNNLDITIVPSSNGIQIKQHTNNIDNENTSGNFITKLWNNNTAMIVVAALFLLFTFFVFSGNLLMFIIISEVIGVGFSVAIFKSVFNNEENQNSLGKVVLIATIASFIFGLLLGLICGIDLYPSYSNCPYCGGKGYFGGGKYGQMVDCPSC